MKHFLVLGVAALALILMGVAPALADEAPVQTVAVDLEQLPAQEEPNMTPAEQPETPDLLGMEDEGRIDRVRVCEDEEQAQCPPDCGCAVFSYGIRCFC